MKKSLKVIIIFTSFFVLALFLLLLYFKYCQVPKQKLSESEIKRKCMGANKYFTYYGMMKNPYCATKYSDAGKACNGGNDCQSGVCYMTFDKANKLIEDKFGKNALNREDINILSITIPDGSGKCKDDDIPDCFSSIQGGVIIENRKMVDRIPFCD